MGCSSYGNAVSLVYGCATVFVARFGIAIRPPASWTTSPDIVRADIDRCEGLTR